MIDLKYFKRSEFKCKCCEVELMDDAFLLKLDKAREISGVPYNINSGYRCVKHNLEIGSTSNNHTSGKAVDIKATTGQERLHILSGLIKSGFKRIGIAKNFIHVDSMDKVESCWLYS